MGVVVVAFPNTYKNQSGNVSVGKGGFLKQHTAIITIIYIPIKKSIFIGIYFI